MHLFIRCFNVYLVECQSVEEQDDWKKMLFYSIFMSQSKNALKTKAVNKFVNISNKKSDQNITVIEEVMNVLISLILFKFELFFTKVIPVPICAIKACRSNGDLVFIYILTSEKVI